MRDWIWILTPVALVMYFRGRPDDFTELVRWLTRLAS